MATIDVALDWSTLDLKHAIQPFLGKAVAVSAVIHEGRDSCCFYWPSFLSHDSVGLCHDSHVGSLMFLFSFSPNLSYFSFLVKVYVTCVFCLMSFYASRCRSQGNVLEDAGSLEKIRGHVHVTLRKCTFFVQGRGRWSQIWDDVLFFKLFFFSKTFFFFQGAIIMWVMSSLK